jgi:hypothetical protein
MHSHSQNQHKMQQIVVVMHNQMRFPAWYASATTESSSRDLSEFEIASDGGIVQVMTSKACPMQPEMLIVLNIPCGLQYHFQVKTEGHVEQF